MSPSAAAYELENDPDSLALEILPLLQYAEMKAVLDGASSEDALKPYERSRVMKKVKANTMFIKHEKLHTTFQDGCIGCKNLRKLGMM